MSSLFARRKPDVVTEAWNANFSGSRHPGTTKDENSMGFLSRLVRDDFTKTALERFVDGVTHSTMSERVKTLDEPLKVPYAQTMTVLLRSRSFTKELKEIAQKMPEPFRSARTFPHDLIFAEIVAFYYFIAMTDYFKEQDREEEGEDGRRSDSYSRALRKSLVLANALVLKRSDAKLPEGFVVLRTAGYSSIGDGGQKSGADALLSFIMKAWNPEPGGRPALDDSAPSLAVRNFIATVPFDEIRELCRAIYGVKQRSRISATDSGRNG